MGILFDKMTSAEALIKAYKLSCIGSDWKESVQRYGADLWANTWKLQNELRNGTYKQKPYVEFDINERGKLRHIKLLQLKIVLYKEASATMSSLLALIRI